MSSISTNPEAVPQPYSDITHQLSSSSSSSSGAGATGQPKVIAMERSRVADVQPTVYEEPAGQQAATAPGTGTEAAAEKVPFKEQVNGYAKKFAGKVFRNEDEVRLGEAKLNGEA
ncbi:hypothetical protein Q5752_004225 [Cryptotrichosporon argae]